MIKLLFYRLFGSKAQATFVQFLRIYSKTYHFMKKTLILTTFLFAMTVLLSCSKGSGYNTNTGNNNGGNPPPVSSNTVSIVAMSFSPANLTVAAGTTVTWTNNDNISHTVTAD